MTADPVTEPVDTAQDPIDLLIAFEEASTDPIRPQYVDGWVIVSPQPDYNHGKGILELTLQLRTAGFDMAGLGMGFRIGANGGKSQALVIPDFYVLHRAPTDLDEAYRKAHKGWYPIDMIALTGEVTSTNHEADTGPKLHAYAVAGIPVYVLVHREERKVHVYSDPRVDREDPFKSHYRTVTSSELGGKVPLPDPYPVLDTSALLP
jgi:hypothetical protein